MPFLEVVTRCCNRPWLLNVNLQSMFVQSDSDWYPNFIFDEVGRGIPWAYQQLALHEPLGSYVWILDDDDMCIYPDLVADLKRIDAECSPDVVMVKMDHGNGAILPDKFHWQRPPAQGYIGVSAFVVKQAIWMQHRHAFALNGGRYESDFDFINAVFVSDPEIYWHDVVASKVQRVSKGEPG